MSLQDPVSDMLTIVRNGQMIKKAAVCVPHSGKKVAILDVLEREGYIEGYEVSSDLCLKTIKIVLKYFKGNPVIDKIRRVSRPGLRIYKSVQNLPQVLGGLGILVVSTPKGVMSDRQARRMGQGGEVICSVA
jgi:small subunit ribosomal protein S8